MNENSIIIIIITHKKEVTPYEEISLRQCFKVLGGYTIRMVCPEAMDVSEYRRIIPGIEIDFIDPSLQATYAKLARLKIEPFIYEKYRKYEFIFFYELDAFVFRNEIEYWCRKGYDYIGAPWVGLEWIESYFKVTAMEKRGIPAAAVGNGGFSLRRTASMLKATHMFSWIYSPEEIWRSSSGRPFIRRLLALLRGMTIKNNSFYVFNDFRFGEDLFWGIHIAHNFKWFKLAPLEESVRFSLETMPRELFERSGSVLPFGCHGWWKYDLAFWAPFIEKEGYLLDSKVKA